MIREVKIKGRELLAANQALNEAAVRDKKDKSQPEKLRYRITRVLKAIHNEVKSLQEHHTDLVKKYGYEVMEEIPDEAPLPAGSAGKAKAKKDAPPPMKKVPTGEWKVYEEKMAEFRKEWEPLAEEEITLQIELIPEDLATTPKQRVVMCPHCDKPSGHEEAQNFTTDEFFSILPFIEDTAAEAAKAAKEGKKGD
jgi:hypothetical protein